MNKKDIINLGATENVADMYLCRKSGMTLKQAGKEIGVCPERIRQAECKVEQLIRDHENPEHEWLKGLTVKTKNILLGKGATSKESVQTWINNGNDLSGIPTCGK